MNWEKYKQKVKRYCTLNHKSNDYVSRLLEYAWNLNSKGLPVIYSPEHLSLLIGIDYDYLCSMAYKPILFYRHFYIPKRNGSHRRIDEPLPDLKYVQKWILENILSNVEVSRYAKAYIKGSTLKHNAKFHRNQKVLLVMDIKDFFPSISIQQIVKVFSDLGYSLNLSCFLAHLCCLKYSIPQGAPTSPMLSNLVMKDFDEKIGKELVVKGVRYTRYADDLTFSGSFIPGKIIKFVSKMIWDYGFSINTQKTRVLHSNTRQLVTGIVVNSHMQIPREKRKKVRQIVYYIKKYGLNSHLENITEKRANYLNHLLGIINFALFINPNDKEMLGYFEFVKSVMKSK